VRFTHFNVMEDPDVREILKEYSRFTAYPQVYINEKFVGGLNFLKEGAAQGGLTHCVPSTEVMLPMKDKILQLVKKSRIMCFMQGSIDFPRSIDSKSMVELISEPLYKSLYSSDEMSYFDMDSDKEIAPALIEYAHFSTIPMLFVEGKLVGSLDLI
jgi:glutaredoxin-related protein